MNRAVPSGTPFDNDYAQITFIFGGEYKSGIEHITLTSNSENADHFYLNGNCDLVGTFGGGTEYFAQANDYNVNHYILQDSESRYESLEGNPKLRPLSCSLGANQYLDCYDQYNFGSNFYVCNGGDNYHDGLAIAYNVPSSVNGKTCYKVTLQAQY